MTANVAHDARIPPPLATDADTATRPMGPCQLCERGVLRGQRYGHLVPSGQAAHLSCIAQAAETPARRPT